LSGQQTPAGLTRPVVVGEGRAAARPSARRSNIAFFDVDDTLVADKSIFSFLAHYFAAIGRRPEAYSQVRDELRRMTDSGAVREEVNRAYYRVYAGTTAPELTRHGERWFADRMARGSFFHPRVLEALRMHAAAGEAVVLVSGSFFPCLEPIARHVGATAVVGTELLVAAAGRFSGEIARPMIGTAKADAAAAQAAARGADLADCYAYGDHISDLPLLQAVGHPVVVGDDPVLCQHVARTGGLRLSAV
jgi:HAD superfamily hydrolase (TIGR01490 family)